MGTEAVHGRIAEQLLRQGITKTALVQENIYPRGF
jgi:hypothetical protein